jgi:hypothetical protein
MESLLKENHNRLFRTEENATKNMIECLKKVLGIIKNDFL